MTQRRGTPVYTVPVFCTIPPIDVPAPQDLPQPPVIGIIAYSGDGARPDVVVHALKRMKRQDVQALLLGSPGSASPEGHEWQRLAGDADLAARLQFSGVVPSEELSRLLFASDVIVFANEKGPSSRRTTLAAALAHGRPTVAIDGPGRWQEAVEEGAVRIVPPEAECLSVVLDELLGSAEERGRMSAAAAKFYDHYMSIDCAAEAFAAILTVPIL